MSVHRNTNKSTKQTLCYVHNQITNKLTILIKTNITFIQINLDFEIVEKIVAVVGDAVCCGCPP